MQAYIIVSEKPARVTNRERYWFPALRALTMIDRRKSSFRLRHALQPRYRGRSVMGEALGVWFPFSIFYINVVNSCHRWSVYELNHCFLLQNWVALYRFLTWFEHSQTPKVWPRPRLATWVVFVSFYFALALVITVRHKFLVVPRCLTLNHCCTFRIKRIDKLERSGRGL